MEFIINNISFSQDVVERNIIRLTNQLWKLIPMREKQEDWQQQLNHVILEIVGLADMFAKNPQFLQLISKLKGLQIEQTDFELYRKTVFESISLLRGSLKDDYS